MRVNDIIKKIEEALKPSQYRAIVKGWDKERYSDIFKDPAYKTDRNGYRVFIPLEYQSRNVQPIQPPADIAQVLADNGFEIQDYVKGIVFNKEKKQSIKIGKVLNKLGRQDLMQKFNNDSRREGTKNKYVVVISRHPYDIAGMSTDRGWTSCMNLKNGINRHYVPLDVEKGSVVAYVTTTDDKNLNNPTGRVLIKPFYDEYSDDGKVYFGIENQVYGTNVPGFTDAVSKWVNMVNTKYNGLTDVAIVKMDRELYKDGSDTRILSPDGEDGNMYSYLKKNANKIPEIIEQLGFPSVYEIDGDEVTLETWNDLERFARDANFDDLESFAELEYEINQGTYENKDEGEINDMADELNPSQEDYEEVLRYLTDRDLKKIADHLNVSGEIGSFSQIRDIAEKIDNSKYGDAMRKAMIRASSASSAPSEDQLKEWKDLLIDAFYRGMYISDFYITQLDDGTVLLKCRLEDFIEGVSDAIGDDEDALYDRNGHYFAEIRNGYSWLPDIDTNEIRNYLYDELDPEQEKTWNDIRAFIGGDSNKGGEFTFDEKTAANIFTKEMLYMESIARMKKLANILKG